MKKRIVVVGSLNVDLVVTAARHPRPGETVPGRSFDRFPGGKGANQAYAAGRLVGASDALSVAMLGQVGGGGGADAYGPWLKESLAGVGVDVSGVGGDPSVPTGMASIVIDAAGQNAIVVVPGANGTFTPDVLSRHEAVLRQADVILLQLEVPLGTVTLAARIGRAAGALVILDPAPAPPDQLPDSLLRDCDYLTPNETELELIAGGSLRPERLSQANATAGARQLIARGARNVVVKLGERGAFLVTTAGEQLVTTFDVEAVDTTAAGDAFNGAFAVALAEGTDPVGAVTFAVAAGALSVTKRGAQPSMPTRAEVAALLARRYW